MSRSGCKFVPRLFRVVSAERLFFEDENEDEDDYKKQKRRTCVRLSARGPLGRRIVPTGRGLKVELIDVILRKDGRRAKQDLAAVDDFEFT